MRGTWRKLFLVLILVGPALSLPRVSFADELVASPVSDHSVERALEQLPELKFTPHRWTKGLHLIAGAGINSSVFDVENEKVDAAIGANIRADVGYYVTDRFAFEASTSVMFNRVDDFLLWDTLPTVGFRYRYPTLIHLENVAPFIRAFVGWGPSVIFFEGQTPEEFQGTGAQRLHIEGFIWGVGLGHFHRSAFGTNWFFEITGSAHYYKTVEAVISRNDVPTVINNNPAPPGTKLYTVTVAIGALLF